MFPEWTQIDSTPLDVRTVHDDGTVDWAELTGLVDQATAPSPRRCSGQPPRLSTRRCC
jgi:hypothetical protein